MSNPVVLITGGLTGIGRATALAFARTGARVVISGRRADAGAAVAASCARSAPKRNSFAPTCGARATWRRWSSRRSSGSAGSTLPSTMPAPRARPAQ